LCESTFYRIVLVVARVRSDHDLTNGISLDWKELFLRFVAPVKPQQPNLSLETKGIAFLEQKATCEVRSLLKLSRGLRESAKVVF